MTIQQIVPRAKALVGLKRQATDRQPSPEDLQAVLAHFRTALLLYNKGYLEAREIH